MILAHLKPTPLSVLQPIPDIKPAISTCDLDLYPMLPTQDSVLQVWSQAAETFNVYLPFFGSSTKACQLYTTR